MTGLARFTLSMKTSVMLLVVASAARAQAPVVVEMRPRVARAGDTVTLVGRHLGGDISVTFDGTRQAAPGIPVLDVAAGDSIARFIVPVSGALPALPGSRLVLTTPTGDAAVPGVLHRGARITAIAPRQVAPGTLVTITGADLRGDVVLQVCTPATVGSGTTTDIADLRDVAVTRYGARSSTSITFEVPAGFVRSPVRLVATLGGAAHTLAMSRDTLVITAGLPVVTGFTPLIARTDDTITVMGRNLGGRPVVYFDGQTRTAATAVSSPAGGDTLVRAIVPLPYGSPGSAMLPRAVAVQTSAGTAFARDSIRIRPLIDSVVPLRGAPGAAVTVFGLSLWGDVALQSHAARASDISAGVDVSDDRMISVSQYVARSATAITFTTPSGFDASPVRLSATVAGRRTILATSRDTLSIPAGTPVVAASSPGLARSGDTITLRGRHFGAAPVITSARTGRRQWAIADAPPRAPADTLVRAILPLDAWAPSRIITIVPMIANAGATAHAPDTLLARPVITSIAPTQAAVDSTVTIHGSLLWGDVYLQVHVADAAALSAGTDVSDTREVRVTSYVARSADSIVFTVPPGFENSPVRLRGIVRGSLALLAASTEVLSVGAAAPALAAITNVVTLRPVTAQPSAPAGTSSCDAGCFDATASGFERATLAGVASVEVDDGERFRIVLRSAADKGHYLALTREQGGAPRAGSFVVSSTCGEDLYKFDKQHFAAEYVLNDYRDGERIAYDGSAGSVQVEEITAERIRGTFTVTACRILPDVPQRTVRVRGRFDARR